MDMSFARNRIRHEILPRLASEFNAQLVRQFEQNDRNPAARRPVDACRSPKTGWTMLTGWKGSMSRRYEQVHPALARRVDSKRSTRERARLLLTLRSTTSKRCEVCRRGQKWEVDFIAWRTSEPRVSSIDWCFPRPTPMSGSSTMTFRIPGTLRIPELGREFRATCLDGPRDEAGLSEGPARVFVDGDNLGS